MTDPAVALNSANTAAVNSVSCFPCPLCAFAEAAPEADPDAELETSDSKRASNSMLHAIAQGSSAFRDPQLFTVSANIGASSHSVVIAASGAALCSCLETMRTGMLCRHMIACMLRVMIVADNGDGDSSEGRPGSSTDGSTGDAVCVPAATAASAQAPAASRTFVVCLQTGGGGGLGVDLLFKRQTVSVKAFTRHKTTGAMLPAEACGTIAVGDVITAINGRNLVKLSVEQAKAVLAGALSNSPMESMLTVRSMQAVQPLAGELMVPESAAGGLTGERSAQISGVSYSTAVAVFRNTHPRWMRPSSAAAASCIVSAAGDSVVLAQVVALAAQRYGAGASGFEVEVGEDWGTTVQELRPTAVAMAHAKIWAMAKSMIADVKTLPPHAALELMRDLSQVARDRVAGNVHDPLIRQRRSKKVIGQRAGGSTAGPAKKKARRNHPA